MLFGAMNFPVNPVVDEIEDIARLGFDYLELAMDPPMAHHLVIASQQAAIAKSLEKHNLGLVCHLPTFLSTADLSDAIRQASLEEMLQSLNVAAQLGARKAVLHPSMVFGMGGFVLDIVKEHASQFIGTMVAAAQRLGVTICLENMMPRNLLGVEPDYFVEIFRDFSALKLTLDTGHANIGDPGGSRLKKLLARCGDRLGHVHVSDNHGMSDDHLPVGAGTVNFSSLIHDLKRSGYDKTLTLEVFVDNRQMLVDSRERIKELLSK
jgi:sugar phosphate isomerase/epimerase